SSLPNDNEEVIERVVDDLVDDEDDDDESKEQREQVAYRYFTIPVDAFTLDRFARIVSLVTGRLGPGALDGIDVDSDADIADTSSRPTGSAAEPQPTRFHPMWEEYRPLVVLKITGMQALLQEAGKSVIPPINIIALLSITVITATTRPNLCAMGIISCKKRGSVIDWDTERKVCDHPR
ncbi:hypothetical protein FOZ63_012332, partial [Perkinsus olseni]